LVTAIIAIVFATFAENANAAVLEKTDIIMCKNFDEPVGYIDVVQGGGVYKGNLFVIIKLTGQYSTGLEIHSTYVAVEEDIDDIPTSCLGRPRVLKFEYTQDTSYVFTEKTTEVWYQIPMEEEGDHDWDGGDTVHIAVFLVIEDTLSNWWFKYRGGWGEGTSFDVGWGMYFTATIEDH
jgi:hypothetical protein